MTTITHTYPNEGSDTLEARARTGGPRGPFNTTGTAAQSLLERYAAQVNHGSHMPLDTTTHWHWRNPLNIIPGFVLLLALASAVSALVG